MPETRKPFFRRFTKKFFIISNVIISLLFLVSCYAGHLDPAGWWPLGLLVLSMPYILLLLLLFLVFWILVKPSLSLIPIVTIVLGWGPIRNVMPFNFSAPFQKQKENGRLRVMSWNVEQFDIIHHKTNPEVKKQMIALVNEYKPDVACFQEMVGSDSAEGINYLGDMQNSLGFGNFYYSYNVKVDYDRQHHFGIIIFSRFPLLKKETVSEYPHDYNSIFQYVDILYYQDTVRLFNIHLQSLRFNEENLQYIDHPTVKDDKGIKESKTIIKKFRTGFQRRGRQAKRVHEEILKSPFPVVVCGDFNDVPNSFAYNTVGDGLQNAFVKKGDGLGRTFSLISPTLRIDNIFVDNRFTIEQFSRVRRKLSAHFPLITDLVLKKNMQ